jgi:phosphopantothenoylcysteine decarboxylase/phosphopantothenate--cysteine ligase
VRPFDGKRVLLVVSGGIAAYKSVHLLRLMTEAGARVEVVMTKAAEEMVGHVTFEALSGRPVQRSLWERPLAHIELGRDADLIVVAPATANILAKLAHGLADDLASATLLAAAVPIVAAPAMNSRMWRNPATRGNLEALREAGVELVGPAEGALAEGEVGIGRMVEPEELLAHVGRRLESPSPLAGRRVVVTAGPTRAPVDPVRYLGNRSSGRMGYALAAAAWRRGAEVVLISGPASLAPPPGPELVRVERAEEMLGALRKALEGASVLCMAAAVSDFRASEVRPDKIKKSGSDLEVRFEPGPDLLAETREARRAAGILSLGFALETRDGVENARRKLNEKGLDMIALNFAGEPGSGFESPTNRVTLIESDDSLEELPLLGKEELADRLLDRIEERLS